MTDGTASTRRSCVPSAGRRRPPSSRDCGTRSSGTVQISGGGGPSKSGIQISSRTIRPSTDDSDGSPFCVLPSTFMRSVNGAVLVTGAAGFAGSHVVAALGGPENVVGWTHHAPPPREIAHLATWHRVDLLNLAEVRDAIARLKPSAVIHCAGAPSVAHSWRDTVTPLSTNVLATH